MRLATNQKVACSSHAGRTNNLNLIELAMLGTLK